MEQSMKNHNELELATRKCLFRILSFLDTKLPECCDIHSFVCLALLKNDPSYQVYYRRKHPSSNVNCLEMDEYSLIIGVSRAIQIVEEKQQEKKLWNLASWTVDEEGLPSAYDSIVDIDWKKDTVAIFAKNHTPHPKIVDFLKNKTGSSGVKQMGIFQASRYFYPIKDALRLELSKMDNVYVKSLERCHAQTIYDHWPRREITTVEEIANELDWMPSAGVFMKDNDELVTWMMWHPFAGMSRLHTLVNHRRMGYASLVAQYLMKRLAQAGLVPHAIIGLENEMFYSCVQNVGCQLISPIHVQFLTGSDVSDSS